MTITMNLNYDQFGNSAAPPLIILHGFFASSRNWRQIARFLAENYCVYVLDLRNHGASPHHPVMDYPSMTADVLEFLDMLGLSQVSVLGHSMGGKVAMWLALNFPDKVNSLIVADIAPVRYNHHFQGIIDSLKAVPLDQMRSRKQVEEFLSDSIPELSFRQFHTQNLHTVDGQLHWKIDLDFFADNALTIPAFPNTHSVKPYQNRALFITGEDSNYVLPDHENAVMSLFPWAKIRSIKNAGHWLHVQQPQLFLDSVENYLREQGV